MCSYWPEAVGEKQPPERPCTHTVRQLATCFEWEEPRQLWKLDRKLQQRFLGDIKTTTPKNVAALPRDPIFWKDLGLVRVASLTTVTQEEVFFVLSTKQKVTNVSAFETIQNILTTREKKKHSGCILVPHWGICSGRFIKMNWVILMVSRIRCWHKPTTKAHELSKKRWLKMKDRINCTQSKMQHTLQIQVNNNNTNEDIVRD